MQVSSTIKQRRGKWSTVARELFEISARKKELEEQERTLKQSLKELSGDESCRDGSFLFQLKISKGPIDYAALLKKHKLDVEPYRKAGRKLWTLIQI